MPTFRNAILPIVLGGVLLAQENKYRPEGSQIPGPHGNSAQPEWLTEMEGWIRQQPSELQNWLADIRAWRAERSRQAETARELASYTDRELFDLGIQRADFPAIIKGTYRR